MIEVGRLAVKIAGRDAGKKCVIVEIIDKNYVIIDGDVRRRKCNVDHLIELKDTIEIKNKASHEDVSKEFEKLGFDVRNTKPKESKERPIRQRKSKDKVVKKSLKKQTTKSEVKEDLKETKKE